MASRISVTSVIILESTAQQRGKQADPTVNIAILTGSARPTGEFCE
jgi:hypothetical protein